MNARQVMTLGDVPVPLKQGRKAGSPKAPKGGASN